MLVGLRSTITARRGGLRPVLLGLSAGILATAVIGSGVARADTIQGVPTQVITILDEANIPAVELARAERAIRAESLLLHQYWDTPVVQFGSHGWPVTLTNVEPSLGGKPFPSLGFHGTDRQHPYGVVYAALHVGDLRWTKVLSHEVMEMLADPRGHHILNGSLVEVCDPMATYPPLTIDGLPLADFATPAWFQWHLTPSQAPPSVQWDAGNRLSWSPADGWLYHV